MHELPALAGMLARLVDFDQSVRTQIVRVRPHGDLIVWDEHMGVVESVRPDDSVQTIEGNSSDQVSRRSHAADSALGYVRMG